MKTSGLVGVALILALASGASATQPLSRGDQMKACAAQWRAQGHKAEGVRYQHFIGECLKRMSAHS